MDKTLSLVCFLLLFVQSSAIFSTPVHPSWCPVPCTCESDEKKLSVNCGRWPEAVTEVPRNLPASIQELGFHSTDIKEIQDGTFIGLKNLKVLNISFSLQRYFRIENEAFKGLDNLEKVKISAGFLIKVPSNLPASIQELDLSSNPIIEIKDGIFGALKSLKILNLGLSSNKLSRIGNRAFEGLDNLAELSLGFRKLTQVPPNLPASIQQLNLMYNQIDELQDGAFMGLRNLEILVLTWNKLMRISSGAFEGLDNLVELDLRFNELTQVPHNLPDTIQELDLSDNKIHEIQDGVFMGLRNLSALNLMSNKINGIGEGSLRGLSNLKTLDVSWMYLNLEHGSMNSLKGTMMDKLDLSHNPICDFPDGVFGGITMKHLVMAYCDCITFNPKAFTNMSLGTLDLKHSSLTIIPNFALHTETLSFRRSLLVLDLSHSSINSDIEGRIFEGFESLRVLDLSHNRISTIGGNFLESLPSLHELNFDGNDITYLDRSSFNSTSLRNLKVKIDPTCWWCSSYVIIEDYEILRYMTSLESLSLQSSRDENTDFVYFIFQNITSLKFLELILQTVQFQPPTFEKTDHIGYGRNGFENPLDTFSIPADMFKGLENLKELHFTNSEIASFHRDTFKGLTSLTVLDLRWNRISMITELSFPPCLLQNLTTLNLSHNRFTCTCELFWFRNWLNANEQKLYNYNNIPLFAFRNYGRGKRAGDESLSPPYVGRHGAAPSFPVTSQGVLNTLVFTQTANLEVVFSISILSLKNALQDPSAAP